MAIYLYVIYFILHYGCSHTLSVHDLTRFRGNNNHIHYTYTLHSQIL